jgi:hypothetical protein
VSGMPQIHSPEIVPYADGRYLMRCHGCGARLWAGDDETAQRLAHFHGRGSFSEHGARLVHAVAVRKDTGRTELIEFDTANAAVGYIARQIERGPGGYAFAYLTGYQTPEHLLNALSAGHESETVQLMSDGEGVVLEYVLPPGEAIALPERSPDIYVCPVCEAVITVEDDSDPVCPNCGRPEIT